MPIASHPYTLASRTSQNANKYLPKSMAVLPHQQTEDRKHGHTTRNKKHRAENTNFEQYNI